MCDVCVCICVSIDGCIWLWGFEHVYVLCVWVSYAYQHVYVNACNKCLCEYVQLCITDMWACDEYELEYVMCVWVWIYECGCAYVSVWMCYCVDESMSACMSVVVYIFGGGCLLHLSRDRAARRVARADPGLFGVSVTRAVLSQWPELRQDCLSVWVSFTTWHYFVWLLDASWVLPPPTRTPTSLCTQSRQTHFNISKNKRGLRSEIRGKKGKK